MGAQREQGLLTTPANPKRSPPPPPTADASQRWFMWSHPSACAEVSTVTRVIFEWISGPRTFRTGVSAGVGRRHGIQTMLGILPRRIVVVASLGVVDEFTPRPV